jgi:hypothetical protein
MEAHRAASRNNSFERGLSRERHAERVPVSHPTESPQRTLSVLHLALNERRNAPEGRLWLPESTPRIAEDREALAMLVIEESVADRPDLQGAYFDGSLELLRELAVTIDVDTALPPLSAIVSKMLPDDALRMACFDERGQLVVNASTADVPDITTCDGEDVIVDDLCTRNLGASAAPHAPERVQDKIDAELRMVGLEQFREMIAERMTLLEVFAGRFNNDSRMIRRLCLEVMDRIASTLEPSLRCTLDADSTRDMSIAAYLHDIGKSGPFEASQESQQAIVKLYAVENVADPDQTIAKTVRMNFSFEEAKSILEHLGSCGMRSTDTMRAFWDRHGYWTHDILEADAEDIPSRARVVAGSHHMDRE